MLTGNKISMVTRFMDRGHHLEKTLPTWAEIPEIDEIIIVDWDSKKDNTLEIVSRFQNGKITVLKVHNQNLFNRGRAWNIGINYAQANFIFSIDSDVMLLKNPLPGLVMDDYTLWRATDKWTSLCGTCIFSKRLWHDVGGYAEFLQGWGHDDDYFHNKLYPLGVKVKYMNFAAFFHLDHDMKDSNRYHYNKDKWKSRELNVATSSLIRKVYFKDEKVTVTSPLGDSRTMFFPVQEIDRKEPVAVMEEIYRKQKAPPSILKKALKDDWTMFVKNNIDGTPSHLEKTSHLSVLQFPRPGRL